VSVVSADITISGKLFHTFTVLGAKQRKIFLNHSEISYLLISGYDLWQSKFSSLIAYPVRVSLSDVPRILISAVAVCLKVLALKQYTAELTMGQWVNISEWVIWVIGQYP